ncbi:hypothetical protein DMN91_011955 [Ooceraea biroi]|uniref:Uncharacterized protein n=1 Tax=Ooceraea biroi TaxID=2015173 RepID=A0A026WPF2_OOCBI|nr:hypothetical protein X777_03158 [Ooceraea biroi]RLU16195.1 hypothetical protein DMN91_011955 [Ooceraea biroi]
MLLEAAVVCAFVGFGIAAYSIQRMGFTVFLHLVKYHYIGFVCYFDDLRKARYNRTELLLLSKRVAVVTGGSRSTGAEVVKKLLRLTWML